MLVLFPIIYLLDELIRQITIDCAERGYLCLRIRDEIKLTLAAYKSLYESSVSFGMRKAILAENEYSEAKKKLTELKESKQHLEKQVEELKFKIEHIEKRNLEQIKNERRKNYDELMFAKKINLQLKCQLDGLIQAKQ